MSEPTSGHDPEEPVKRRRKSKSKKAAKTREHSPSLAPTDFTASEALDSSHVPVEVYREDMAEFQEVAQGYKATSETA